MITEPAVLQPAKCFNPFKSYKLQMLTLSFVFLLSILTLLLLLQLVPLHHFIAVFYIQLMKNSGFYLKEKLMCHWSLLNTCGLFFLLSFIPLQ